MAGGSFVLPLLSLALLCSCLTFEIVKADLISNVCSLVKPVFCNKVLRSDHRSAKADLHGLGVIAIDKAMSSAHTTLSLAKELGSGQVPKTCVEVCKDAIDLLKECRYALSVNDKKTLNALGSAALDDFDTCDDESGKNEPSKLKQASQTTQDIISIILAVSVYE